MWDALETRRGIGWGLVMFFLGLTNRAWEDLSVQERVDVWRVAETECYACWDIGYTAVQFTWPDGFIDYAQVPCGCIEGDRYR